MGDNFLGLIGFVYIDRHNQKAEIGYSLSQKAQEKGIIFNSFKALYTFYFTESGLNRIQIKVATKNTKSPSIPEKLNFQLEGIERDGELLVDNKYVDLAIYGLLKKTLKNMQIIKYPSRETWTEVLARPTFDVSSLNETVNSILTDIKRSGDKAVLTYEEKFDKAKLSSLIVSQGEINSSETKITKELKEAISTAQKNIETFHSAQKFESRKIETTAGVFCWQKSVGIEKVGLYIPGGTAPLFSTVLMLAIPATIAGCKEIVLCSPPDKDGNINPAILYAAKISGVNKVFKIGGVQAIGAMAYGTESVPKVYKIFGPGNQYVMAAKQLVSLKDVAIDMPAGPSEVQVIGDETSNPAFIASDLLSQAEHGVDSQVIFITTSESLIDAVIKEIDSQLTQLPRKEIAEKALMHSKAILLKNEEDVIAMTNEYAPEHLIIETKNYIELADKITNAGSVFLGKYTPESAGDYASGTNHTLPTNGYAKAYSGVNLDSFIRKITFQEISKEGIHNLGSTIEVMAENEQLFAHKNAVTLRLTE